MENLTILGAFFTALIISLVSIPSIVAVAKQKELCEKGGGRRLHEGVIPTLGGCAIFAGLTISMLLFCKGVVGSEFVFGLAAAVIMLFFIGIKDDILLIAPLTKLFGQIFAATLLVVFGDVRITSLGGIFGFYELPYLLSLLLSVFLIITCINAYNLIDGVDGLAGLLSVTAVGVFSVWFYLEGVYSVAIVGVSFIGAVLGFLRYNMFSKKNKIFMGDTGSMIVGLICATMALRFMQYNAMEEVSDYLNPIQYAPFVALTFMIVPLYDVVRVMFIRYILHRPIMQPDNHHIHYRLKSLGFTHKQIDFWLVTFNALFAVFSWWISQHLSFLRLVLVEFLVLMFFFHIPQAIITKRKEKQRGENK